MAVGLRGQIKSAAISFATANDNVIVAAVAGKLITVIGMVLSVQTTATNITVKDGAGNNLSGAMALAPGTPLVLPVDPTVDWYQTSSGANALILNQGAGTSQVSGTVWYIQN